MWPNLPHLLKKSLMKSYFQSLTFFAKISILDAWVANAPLSLPHCLFNLLKTWHKKNTFRVLHGYIFSCVICPLYMKRFRTQSNIYDGAFLGRALRALTILAKKLHRRYWVLNTPLHNTIYPNHAFHIISCTTDFIIYVVAFLFPPPFI